MSSHGAAKTGVTGGYVMERLPRKSTRLRLHFAAVISDGIFCYARMQECQSTVKATSNRRVLHCITMHCGGHGV